MNPKQPELLAPAGTPDAAWAALEYGAEAIYCGLPRFSARAEAGNFTADALDELIGYAHHLGRRVYITFNTLVQERELPAALDNLALVRDLNADGVIVQDMGVAHLVRKQFPQLNLHASTQLAVHNLAGAKQLAELGFKRVVLARELSLADIRTISQSCGIETEAFIHGALCYSYSGLCLFSSHLLGRSGNRGRCAYSCRQPFKTAGHETLPFSMKDFSAAEHLDKMLACGVSSLKMEGRMKGPLYVAAVTDFYRRLLDGKLGQTERRELLADIQTIFGRPSTDLYLEQENSQPVDPVNDGHRGAQIGTIQRFEGPWLILRSNRALEKRDGLKIETARTHPFGFAADEMRLAKDPEHKRRFELPANAEIAIKPPHNAPRFEIGTPVYCSYSQAVRQRYSFTAPRPGQFRQRRTVNISVSATPQSFEATASGCGAQAQLTLDGPFELARQPEKSVAAIEKSFSKLGDTDWSLGKLSIAEDSAPVFVPASVLNDLRRRLVEALDEAWEELEEDEPSAGLTESERAAFTKSLTPGAPVWSVKAQQLNLLQHLPEVDEIILEISPDRADEIQEAVESIPAETLRLALPVIIDEADITAYRDLIAAFPNQQKWEAANLGGLQLLKGRADLTADWQLYTLNTQSATHWHAQDLNRFVLSPEDDAQNLCALIGQLGTAAIVPVYQHTPLMISATEPAMEESEGLVDRSKRAFHVEQQGRKSVLVRETPFSLSTEMEQLADIGARSFRIDLSFGIETAAEAAKVVRDFIAGSPVPGHTGNFTGELK